MGSDFAAELMLDFARRTGLAEPSRPPVRYLWTDAFAVCNLLGLYEEVGDGKLLDLALRLVDQVHHVLGRHRSDDARSGWLSGLPEELGHAHPTRGGLRIGKPLPERRPDEPFDPSLEWDRDGQYFHYLTRWMHALDRAAVVSRDATYHRFACELAQAACAGFLHDGPDGSRRLCWKMSIGLDRPLVASTGQHDPLDGFVTACELQASSARYEGPDLEREVRQLAALCAGGRWDTDDPLGIGGLLCDAHRLGQLARAGGMSEPTLLETILGSALRGIATVAAGRALAGAAERRLAFRELGLSIGLHAVERMESLGIGSADRHRHDAAANGGAAEPMLRELSGYRSLTGRIEGFWLDPRHRASRLWREHRDINDVMLATSLAPAGYLTVGVG